MRRTRHSTFRGKNRFGRFARTIFDENFAMNDVIILRALFGGIRSLLIPELIIYIGVFFLWVFGIYNLVWNKFKKKKKFAPAVIKKWLIVSLILISGQIVLLEYFDYLNRSHTQTMFWGYMVNLLIPSAMIGDIFGLLSAHSPMHYRFAFYIGIIFASFLFAAPLLGIRMMNKNYES